MTPEEWGKHGWKFIHAVTLGYPLHPTEEDKKYYRNFISDLQHVLPCTKCQKHLEDHLKESPLEEKDLENRSNFVKWGIDLHNRVNASLGKKNYTYDDALIEMYRIPSDNYALKVALLTLFIILIVIIIIMIIFFSVKNRKN